jgi:triacylglycerol lipase
MSRSAFYITMALAASAAASLYGQEPSAYGFDTSFSELILLERLDAAVRYDPDVVIEANWRELYDRVAAVEVASTKSRYALFEDEGRRRFDIAIRGTANLKNAVFDLEFLKQRSGRLGIYLHSGFEKSAVAIYADLKPRLKAGYSMRIAGHSLGAAEAIILGMLLSSEGYKVEKVLASAPPKVTDAEGWARFAKLKVLRVAGPFDPVPFLPPRGLIYGNAPYIQGGRLILLLDGDKYAIREGESYDDLPDAEKGVFAEGRQFAVADHLLPAYLSRLLPKAKAATRVDAADWDRYAVSAEK